MSSKKLVSEKQRRLGRRFLFRPKLGCPLHRHQLGRKCPLLECERIIEATEHCSYSSACKGTGIGRWWIAKLESDDVLDRTVKPAVVFLPLEQNGHAVVERPDLLVGGHGHAGEHRAEVGGVLADPRPGHQRLAVLRKPRSGFCPFDTVEVCEVRKRDQAAISGMDDDAVPKRIGQICRLPAPHQPRKRLSSRATMTKPIVRAARAIPRSVADRWPSIPAKPNTNGKAQVARPDAVLPIQSRTNAVEISDLIPATTLEA